MHTFKINIGSLTTPVKGGGYIEVFPATSGNGIVKSRDKDNFYKVRKKLKSELVFTGSEYTALETLKANEDKFIELEIYNDSVLKLYGYLLFSGSWDENKKVCSMIFQTIDQYSELEQNLDVQKNILSLSKNSVYMAEESTVENITLPCFAGRKVEAQLYYDPDGHVSSDPGVAHPDWAYYLDNGEESGCSPSEYSYKFVTTYITFAHPDYTKSELYAERYLKASATAETALLELDRAVKEYDILDSLLKLADNTLTYSKLTYSDYINDTDNEIYNLFYFDKSDVKRYDSTNAATFQYMRLGDMLNMYEKFFNLFHNIDDDGNFTLKFINDLSEANYTTYPAHDLTDFKDKNWTNNQKKYTTDSAKKTSKEILTHEIETSFIDYELYFDSVIEDRFDNYNNDIAYLVSDPDEVEDNGFTMATCDGSNVIINKTPGATEIVNYGMHPGRLLYNHIRNANRPYSTGKLNSLAITLTKEKDEALVYKNIPIYDIDELNFDHYIKIDLGLAIIDSLEISFEKEYATLTMKI